MAMINNFENHDIKPAVGKVIIPKIQLTILAVILIGYPLISTIMNYINPPDDIKIVSRIWQMILVFSILMLSIVMAPLRQGGDFWNSSENLASIGIKRKDFSWLNLVIGVIFVFVAIIILNMLSNVIGYYGFFQAEDITYLLPRSPVEKAFWIALSISAGVTEEICFRGFVLTRMTVLTGSVWPGVILGSLSFGLGHLYQGWAGVVLIGVYGLMFSLLFIARGSLIPCVIAHALQDILAAFAV